LFSLDNARSQNRPKVREDPDFPKSFVPNLSHGNASSTTVAGGIRRLDGAQTRLLTVREVASVLAVSTATVYKLCTRGELAHVRVSNAIRVTPTALLAALQGRGKGQGRAAT
jgi:excisionase family DNA binding protein